MKGVQHRYFWLLVYCFPFLVMYVYFNAKIEALKAAAQSSVSAEPTWNDNNAIVIYNRVPKTGSTSFTNAVAYDMCKTNQFHVLHLNVTKNRHTLTLSDQRRFIQNVSNWSERKPAFYHGHVAFLDFTRFGQHNPIYINLLREPLERLVSHYYFLRFGDNFRVGLKRSRDGDTETFDDCVARNGKDCDPKQMWLQVPFFCGHSSLCWEAGNAWALEQAKRNLINHYLLVGITENIDQFIELLEATLPRFFKGASAHFASLDESRSHMRNTKKKILPNTTTITVMKESPIYRMESEFYLFAKEQFEFALQRYTASNNENENIALSSTEFHYEKIRPIDSQKFHN